MTKYEQVIYQIITQSTEHLTAEQTFSELKKRYPAVSRATVYNNLNKLCAAGLIRRILMEGEADRYDRTARHDHIVCSRCGKLMDICFEDLTGPLERQLGEDILFYDLKVYCLCPECRRKQEENL